MSSVVTGSPQISKNSIISSETVTIPTAEITTLYTATKKCRIYLFPQTSNRIYFTLNNSSTSSNYQFYWMPYNSVRYPTINVTNISFEDIVLRDFQSLIATSNGGFSILLDEGEYLSATNRDSDDSSSDVYVVATEI